MKKPGSVSLAEVAKRATHIELACTRCDRHGRYRVDGLIGQFGPDFGMPDLAGELASCPNRKATNPNVRCDVFFRGLGALMRGEAADDEDPGRQA
ncbi:hypothetical protein HDG35_004465 [Paraburkholderia sp. JPY681]|nr:hypothetical protein [Paraburkholderia atlantica]